MRREWSRESERVEQEAVRCEQTKEMWKGQVAGGMGNMGKKPMINFVCTTRDNWSSKKKATGLVHTHVLSDLFQGSFNQTE